MDHIADYIIPILIAVFYLVTSGKKKKQQEAEKQRRLSQPPRPSPAEKAKKPPVIRNETVISQHMPQIQTNLSERASTAKLQKVSTLSKSLTDRGVSARIDGKNIYAIKSRPTPCRGITLIRKMPSLQDAFVFHEIFNRYDDKKDY